MTPVDLARRWAKDNREFAGIIDVVSLVPKGKGGWGLQPRTTRFFAVGGKVAAKRFDRGKWYATRRNGLCWVCGTLSLEKALRIGWRRDPEAWLLLGSHPTYLRVRGTQMFVQACEACFTEHDLVFIDELAYWGEGVFFSYRTDIELVRYHEETLPVVTLDLTWQGGVEYSHARGRA